MPWKGFLKWGKPCGSVRVFILCFVVAWKCTCNTVFLINWYSSVTWLCNLSYTETSGMSKLCHFPGIKIQNNLSYKIAGPFVSCVLTVCLSHRALSASSGFLGAVSREVGFSWYRGVTALFAAPGQYLQSVIWGQTLSSDFSDFLQFLRLFSGSCWCSKSVLSEGVKCIWRSRMKCMWIKYVD